METEDAARDRIWEELSAIAEREAAAELAALVRRHKGEGRYGSEKSEDYKHENIDVAISR